jgi:hypothetical protein
MEARVFCREVSSQFSRESFKLLSFFLSYMALSFDEEDGEIIAERGRQAKAC